jgi:tRNA(fMet)-specific endonuclease VapC
MAYLIDSDVLIRAFRGYARTVALLMQFADQPVSVCLVSAGELYEGAFSLPSVPQQLAALRAFLNQFPVVPLNDAVMVRFAEIRSFLRRSNLIISDFDIVIAATALEFDLTVVTYNVRHFERIPGLRIYQP